MLMRRTRRRRPVGPSLCKCVHKYTAQTKNLAPKEGVLKHLSNSIASDNRLVFSRFLKYKSRKSYLPISLNFILFYLGYNCLLTNLPYIIESLNLGSK